MLPKWNYCEILHYLLFISCACLTIPCHKLVWFYGKIVNHACMSNPFYFTDITPHLVNIWQEMSKLCLKSLFPMEPNLSCVTQVKSIYLYLEWIWPTVLNFVHTPPLSMKGTQKWIKITTRNHYNNYLSARRTVTDLLNHCKTATIK